MYAQEELERYPYFAEEIREHGMTGMLDQLTGVVSRGHILWFAQWLTAHQVPFSFAMLDLDNFKFINDTYGHYVGDQVLIRVAQDLAAFMAGRGVVGRFGGDELMIVNLRDTDYNANKALFAEMYEGGNRVVRKRIILDECSPFVTGTIGCASYPKDAQDYDTLFGMIDKTLYRGKTKGRNCYIIYVEEKHKDIQIRRIARHGMYTTMNALVRRFEFVPGLMNKLRSVMPLLMDELQITDLYYTGSGGIMRSVRQADVAEPAQDLDKLLQSDDLYTGNTLIDVQERSPVFCETLKKREIETLCVVRISMNTNVFGYLICAEARSKRIWQETECAILFFLSKMIAGAALVEGEKLE